MFVRYESCSKSRFLQLLSRFFRRLLFCLFFFLQHDAREVVFGFEIRYLLCLDHVFHKDNVKYAWLILAIDSTGSSSLHHSCVLLPTALSTPTTGAPSPPDFTLVTKLPASSLAASSRPSPPTRQSRSSSPPTATPRGYAAAESRPASISASAAFAPVSQFDASTPDIRPSLPTSRAPLRR